MTNAKTTKRALLVSSVSLLLCFAMLLGTTFAWFTDSATSANNKIMAGKLDVKLLMNTGSGYADISNSTEPIFGASSLIAQDKNADTLWEPGKTQVAYLAIENAGNLDLKYTVALNVENVSKDLYEVMEYAIIPDAQYDTVTAWTSGNSVTEGTQSVSNETELKKGEIHHFALAIHMDEEAGNDYQGGEVNFDLTVLATQLNSEEDSFGKDYDKGAEYDTDVPLAATKAFKATDSLQLTKDDGTKVAILGKNLSISTKESPAFGAHLGENVSLDTAYQFEPTMSEEDGAASEYADWHADFVVYADNDVPDGSIALAGYYTAWCQLNNYKWVALPNYGLPVDANEEIRLVDSMGGGNITVSYKEICQYGNDGVGFLCGAKALNPELLKGTTLTVELRLYEATGGSRGSETGKYITVGTYKYKF